MFVNTWLLSVAIRISLGKYQFCQVQVRLLLLLSWMINRLCKHDGTSNLASSVATISSMVLLGDIADFFAVVR